MKDSRLLYTYGTVFFAVCFLAPTPVATAGAYVAGIICMIGGYIAHLGEKKQEKALQELVKSRNK